MLAITAPQSIFIHRITTTSGDLCFKELDTIANVNRSFFIDVPQEDVEKPRHQQQQMEQNVARKSSIEC